MKKLLKSVIYGFVNSIRKYYSRKTWSTIAAWKKRKKKEKGKRKKKKRGRANVQSKHSQEGRVGWDGK